MVQNHRSNGILRVVILSISSLLMLGVLGWVFSTPWRAQAQLSIIPAQWHALPAIRTGIGEPAATIVKGKIHLIGGVADFGVSGFHEAFDPETWQWETLPGLPLKRSNAAVAVLDDKLYVMGGYNSYANGALTATHIYVPATQSWLTATSMISPASGAGAAVIGDEIFVFGGFDNIAESQRVQSYQPSSDTWTLRTPMPVARSEFGLATVDGLVYAIGGNILVYTETESLSFATNILNTSGPNAGITSALASVYNPATDQWHDVASLPEPRAAMAVAVRNGEIYVIGGLDNWFKGTVQDSVYVYNPQTNLWSTMTPIITARSGVRAIGVNEAIYVLGGYDQSFASLAVHEAFGITVNNLYLPSINR